LIVLDASAAILGLLNDGEARSIMASEALACPHLVDAEVVHALRSLVTRTTVDASTAESLLSVWQGLGIERMAVDGLLIRIWQLRENLSAYDATYVALAEGLEVPLVTADARIAGAPGLRCPVTVIRR
jgi:predicted nucleic acid-binding protein